MHTIDLLDEQMAFGWLLLPVLVVAVAYTMFLASRPNKGSMKLLAMMAGVLLVLLVSIVAAMEVAKDDRREYMAVRFEVAFGVTPDAGTLKMLDRLEPGDAPVVIVLEPNAEDDLSLLVKPDEDGYGELLYVREIDLDDETVEVLSETPFIGELKPH